MFFFIGLVFGVVLAFIFLFVYFNNQKVQLRPIERMNQAELMDELHGLRQMVSRHTTFMQLVDRIFCWKIFRCRIKNPLAYGVDSESFPKDRLYLDFMTWTDKPFFVFEELLDAMVRTMQRDVFKAAKRKAQGFVIKTLGGKYEIVIRQFNEKE